MKKLLQLIVCGLLVMAASSCSQGAAAIDKAYEQACEANSPEKVATTLCNGNIKVSTLTEPEYAKLGAVIGYITYTGLYSANFEAQVDMYQFGNLLKSYRQHNQTASERLQIDEMTKNILTNCPAQTTDKK